MAIAVPAQPKVYTTKYDSFKGVDFTNDQTNVWRRRSPTGRNMLPDASGRPFKRHGWEILISNADIQCLLSAGVKSTARHSEISDDVSYVGKSAWPATHQHCRQAGRTAVIFFPARANCPAWQRAYPRHRQPEQQY